MFSPSVALSILFSFLYRGRYWCGFFGTNLVEAVFAWCGRVYTITSAEIYPDTLTLSAVSGRRGNTAVTIGATLGAVLANCSQYSGGFPRRLAMRRFWRRNQHLTGGHFHWRRDFWLRLSAIVSHCLHRAKHAVCSGNSSIYSRQTISKSCLDNRNRQQSYHTPLRVTVHCLANCNIRNPHLKFCFAKEGCSH